jgi:hypothetical protein
MLSHKAQNPLTAAIDERPTDIAYCMDVYILYCIKN